MIIFLFSFHRSCLSIEYLTPENSMDPVSSTIASAAIPALVPSLLKDTEKSSDTMCQKWTKIIVIIGIALLIAHQLGKQK